MKSDYIKPDVIRLLIHSMSKKSGLALRLCLETGLRIGDALKIRPEDISGRVLTYTAEKTGKSGKKTLSSELIRDLRSISSPDWVFPGRSRSKTGHLTRQAVYLDLKRVCKKLGVEGQISPHTARKSYAVDEYHKHGLDGVKEELQHSSDAVALLYALSDVSTSDNAIEDKINQIVKIVQEILKIVLDIRAHL